MTGRARTAFETAADAGVVAPYTFVRIEPHVMPSPLEEPDHGRPLPDGLCGELVVSWQVEKPFLVGGREGENNAPFTVGGVPAIPGASLRGLLRSVLEIASYARLAPFLADRYFGVRDFEHPSWKHRITQRKPGGYGRVHYSGDRRPVPVPGLPAWLVPSGRDAWTLQPCRMVLVPVSELLRHLDDEVTARQWHGMTLPDKLAILPSRLRGRFPLSELGIVLDPKSGRRLEGNHAFEDRHGTLVMAGRWESWANGVRDKKYEAVFLEPTPGDRPPPAVPLSTEVFARFDTAEPPEAIPADGKTARTLWRFWRCEVKAGRAGRVPVFYEGDPALAAQEGSPAPADFYLSLTRFMRIPHRFSVAAALRRTQHDDGGPERLDFCQALFGHVPDEAAEGSHPVPSKRAWRSRLFFSQALVDDPSVVHHEEVTGVAMAPKPSFHPFYLRRPDGAAGDAPFDWSNEAMQLAGRKRYVPRDAARWPQPEPEPADRQHDAPASRMTFIGNRAPDQPLTFTGRIRFHNLLPVELGALVWALTLGEHGAGTRKRRHMLGRGKVHGYGQTQVHIVQPESRVDANDGGTPPDLATCMRRFEDAVAAWHPDGTTYSGLPQIRDLLAVTDVAKGRERSKDLRLPRGTAPNGADPVVAGYVEIQRKNASLPLWGDDEA